MFKKFFWLLVIPNLFASNCDLTKFKWDCDLKPSIIAKKNKSSLFYCGNSYAYLTPKQLAILSAYQRAAINVVLKINNQYITSPCYPSDNLAAANYTK